MPRNSILIVEDEILVALDLEDMLGELGCHVQAIVADQTSALRLQFSPSVAFVDLNLRDGPTGAAVARWLSDAYGTSIVYMTANPAQIDGFAATGIGLLEKPFSRAAVEAVTAMLFDGGNSVPVPAGITFLPSGVNGSSRWQERRA